MNFQQWTRTTQRKLADEGGGTYFRQKDVDRVMRTALEVLKEELREGGELSQVDIGRLYTEHQKARTIKSNLPRQCGVYQIAEKSVVRFKASKSLKLSITNRASSID